MQPNSGVTGTYPNALMFRAWDQTTGTDGSNPSTSTNGGATAFSIVNNGVQLTITSAAAAPGTLELSLAVVGRNPAIGPFTVAFSLFGAGFGEAVKTVFKMADLSDAKDEERHESRYG